MKRRKFIETVSLASFLTNAVAAKNILSPDAVTAATLFPGGDLPAKDFFYKPQNAWAADFIPFYDNGKYHLFYLLDWRDQQNHGEGTPWYKITTTDFVHFEEHGQMLPRGTKDEQDLYVFTGSVIKALGQYHIFYTGHNPHFEGKKKPVQGVMHAVSNDLEHWTKLPEHTFFATDDAYEKNDWRDPFVFWNDATGEYNMLLAARFTKGIPRRRGLTALCTSRDLITWQLRQPMYAPNLYYTHECPDLFKIGDWWYLLFSEFTDLVATRYRMSRSLNGPWTTPNRDTFDGHAFYAAKTASNGKDRYIFGWNPTRSEAKDAGDWNWGGNLVVHKIEQQPNGELTVRIPDTVAAAFTRQLTPAFTNGTGDFRVENGEVVIKAGGTFGAVTGGKLPKQCLINMRIDFAEQTKACGLMFRTSNDFDKSYYITLEPQKNRLVFDKWPRDRSEVNEMVELARDIKLKAGMPVNMKLIIDDNKGVVYVDDTVAMNFRAYDINEENWGVFVSDGTATFKNIAIAAL